jgi:PEP-CTERM motif
MESKPESGRRTKNLRAVQLPILSDTLTINGHSVSGIGGYIDSASVQAGVQFEVSAAAANGTWLVFSVSSQSAGLPFQSLSAPLTYLVNGDAVGSFYLFDSTGQIQEDTMNLNPTEVTISPAPVPLPATLWLMLGGLGGVGVFVRIKRIA